MTFFSAYFHFFKVYLISVRCVEYQRPAPGTNGFEQRVFCDYGKPAPHGKVCDVNMANWGQCTKENKYGYSRSAPCIFLKLNKVRGAFSILRVASKSIGKIKLTNCNSKCNFEFRLALGCRSEWKRNRHSHSKFVFQIFGWKPHYYNDTKNLPSSMPADLQEHIKQQEQANKLETVWVSCAGENPADVENMGAIQYIPHRGFPGYYFPFTNTPGYLSPLVAVFFEKPKCT